MHTLDLVGVGRDAELLVLHGALQGSVGGLGAAVVVVGDAGIGKSTLVADLIGVAHATEVRALQTRCSDDPSAPALWPWELLLRSWAAERETAEVAERLEQVHPLVRRLAPDISERAGLDVPAAPGDEFTGRFVTGDGLGRLLVQGNRPVVVVIEDLHHADAGTRGLIEPFAGAVVSGGGLLVVTTRDATTGRAVLSTPGSIRLDLTALPDHAATVLVRSVAPELEPSAVEAIVRRGKGNPFYLAELSRLGRSGAATSTSPAVQDIVRERVERLGPDADEVLSAAALLGPVLDLEILGSALSGPDVVEKVIDDALDSGLLVADDAVVRWQHDLVPEALTEGLGTVRARRLHAALAHALDSADRRDDRAVAHHLLAAGARDVRAADAGETAAALAAERGAHEEVLRWVGRTLPVAEHLGDPRRIGRLGLLAGRAEVGLERRAAARDRLLEAARAFLAAGDSEGAAHAALAIGAERMVGGEDVEPPLDLLDEVLAAVPDRADLRCRLIGRRADVLVDRRAAEAAAAEAVTLARATGDPGLLIFALGRLVIFWRDRPPEETASLLQEIAGLTEQVDPEARYEALAYHAVRLTEDGDLAALEQLLPRLEAMRLRLGLPPSIGFAPTESLVLIHRGRFDRSLEVMNDFVEATSAVDPFRALIVQALHRGIVQMLQGELGEAMAMVDLQLQLTAGTPLEIDVHAVRACVAALAGRIDEARQSIEAVFAPGLDALFDEPFGTGIGLSVFLAEGVALAGTSEQAAALHDRLAGWSGRLIVGGMAPAIAFGPADHCLALLARARGDHERAGSLVKAAAERCRSIGAPPFLARSLALSAELAVAAGDADAAEAAAREAGRLASLYGLRLLGEAAARVLASLGAAPVRGATVSGPPIAIVFTDIEDSTMTAAALGDQAWMARLRSHDTAVRRLCAANGGREIKHLGDGFLLTFPAVTLAVDFARSLQAELADGPLTVRAGIHTGAVIEEDGDIFGTNVNLAARVAGAALGGEVLLSDDVAAVAGAPLGEARVVELKGLPEPARLHPLLD